MELTIEQAYQLCRDVLQSNGHSENHAEIMTNVIMYAQLRNPQAGQGFAKLRSPGMPINEETGDILIENSGRSFASLKGAGNPGMVVMNHATNVTLEKMVSEPIVLVTTRNNNSSVASSSTGAIGYFAQRIADAGYIGIVTSKPSIALVAPYGSIDRVFSTNPIAYGFPSEEGPVVIDLTTATSSFFQVVEAMKGGESLASGLGYDPEGNETIKPKDIIQGGALKAFGEQRGSAFAYVMESFAAIFGASYAGQHQDRGWFNMIIAINPNVVEPVDEARKNISSLNDVIRGTRPSIGNNSVYVPGDRGTKRMNEQLSTGKIEIDDGLYHNLRNQVQN